MARVVVVGAGVAGLSAARSLSRDHDVVVLESGRRIGGKLLGAEVGGVAVDVGAEAMLNRRPEGVQLLRSLGVQPVHPTAARSRLWIGDRLLPLPRTLMGVPTDRDSLLASGVLDQAGMAAVDAEPTLPPRVLDRDVSVAELLGDRLGRQVLDRLVEPLLGGVYAGHARLLSARATVPQLVAMAERGSLVRQAAALPVSDRPVFAGLPGGMGRLPALLAEGLDVRCQHTVREMRRTGDGLELVVGPTTAPATFAADQVVLATPAPASARLLRAVAPVAAAELSAIEYASMVVVSLAFRATDVPRDLEACSGFLVPPSQGRAIKAATISAAKWDWVREAGAAAGLVHLRTSLGRHREEAGLQAADEELVTRSLADLAAATGLRTRPVDAHVQRWGGALPQYALGHRERVDRIRAALPADVAVCGAAYDGVGIPACIASAHAAVEALGRPAPGSAEDRFGTMNP